MHRDGEGKIHRAPHRRAQDSVGHFVRWLEDGADAEPSATSLAQVRQMHEHYARRYAMSNETFLHTIALFTLQFDLVLERLGARRFTRAQQAQVSLWRGVGERLAIEDMPHDWAGMRSCLERYERDPAWYGPSVAGNQCGEAVLGQFTDRWLPRPLHRVGRWLVLALSEDHVIEILWFASLPGLRAAITNRVAAYNQEPFQKRPGSRASVFESEEQPLLTGLPQVAYEISRWVYGRRVGRNGHVVWERNFYSVPFAHVGSKVDLRINDRVLQAYRGQERLTSHLLLPEDSANEYRTNDADLPAGQRYRQWDPDRVRDWAERIGPSAVVVVTRIFESVPVDEQGLDPALAVLRLSRRFSAERVEAACRLALAGRVRSPRYAHLQPILATGQDKTAGLRPLREEPAEEGGYVRGATYYAGGAK